MLSDTWQEALGWALSFRNYKRQYHQQIEALLEHVQGIKFSLAQTLFSLTLECNTLLTSFQPMRRPQCLELNVYT